MSNSIEREMELGAAASVAPGKVEVAGDEHSMTGPERRPALDASATLLQAFLGTTAGESSVLQEVVSFETVALPVINDVWGLEQLEYQHHWQLLHGHGTSEALARHRELSEQALQEIMGALGARTLAAATSFLLHPQLWQPFYEGHGDHRQSFRAQVQARLLQEQAQAFVERVTPPAWPHQLCQRIVTLCSAALASHAPHLGQCISWLLELEERERALEGGPQTGEETTEALERTLDALTLGDWEGAWREITALAGPASAPSPSTLASWPGNSRRPILNGWQQASMAERLHQLWSQTSHQHLLRLVRRMYGQGRLTSASFRAILEAHPETLRLINHALTYRTDGDELAEPGLKSALLDMVDAAIWELLRDFRPEAWPALTQVGALRGGHALLRLVEEVERLGLTRLSPARYGQQQAATVLGYLCGILERRPDDGGDSLSSLLGYVSAPALLAVLPLARSYTDELCAGLGWPGARALVGLLRRLEADQPSRSSNPLAGVVRREEVLGMVSHMEEEHARALLDAFAPQHPGAALLVRAALGWNRKEVRQAFGRRSQLAARAMGLLPLEGADALLERYLLLRKYLQASGSSGAGRKAYERAAAHAGLANLALQAGYADPTRLEWAMEERVGAERASIGRSWEIEGYRLTLVLRAGAPALELRRGEKLLKRTPKAVVREYEYREVRATLEQARGQERRYRQAFLDAMCSGSTISQEELRMVVRNPLACSLLERLVVIAEDGAVGLFRAEDCALEGLYGERVRLGGGLRIAHPHDLAQAGLLGDWQAEIVRRQIVQPFKQVFRELYLLTPAEQQARYSSARLAGRGMKSRTALAVLANMGWVLKGDGYAWKPFYALGYGAHFETGGGWREDDEPQVTTGGVTFWPLDQRHQAGGERRIALETLPPVVFSEVMRDLDMVTVIAHRSDELGTSQEVLQRRGELVRAIAGALRLQQVEVQGHAVFVQGNLARYRIHLATAAIYLETGQYLCVVPERKQQQALYLPFAEGGEPIVGEIVSKVLLLANDQAIADPTILAQLAPMRRAA